MNRELPWLIGPYIDVLRTRLAQRPDFPTREQHRHAVAVWLRSARKWKAAARETRRERLPPKKASLRAQQAERDVRDAYKQLMEIEHWLQMRREVAASEAYQRRTFTGPAI